MTRASGGPRDVGKGVVGIALDDVSHRFGPVQALNGVSIALRAGEVHALLGENGAGKSTLISVLTGNLRPQEGTVSIRGQRQSSYTPSTALTAGINAVLQNFSLSPDLSVLDNLYLGREASSFGLLSRRTMVEGARRRLAEVGLDVSLDREVGALSRAEQQLLEIAKALGGEPGVLLLDEPTAAISDAEAERLFEIVEHLRAENWAICYISHRMEEVQRLGDRYTVIRRGERISTGTLPGPTADDLVRDMVGKELSSTYPPRGSTLREEVLSVDRLSSVDGRVRGVSLSVRGGEIVAVAGLVGCGKAEVARLIMGLDPIQEGEVRVGEMAVRHPSPRKMLGLGVGYMPEDRKLDGLVMGRSIEDNITLEVIDKPDFTRARVFRSRGRATALARSLAGSLDIRPGGVAHDVEKLSGGNQQKVVLARALTRERQALVIVEPTSGVDVGARTEIYARLRALCDQGVGVLMVSSDIDEIVGLSDRVVVLNSGVIAGTLVGQGITKENVVAKAFGQLVEN